VSEVKGSARDIAAEHRGILEATLERDADRAAALLQQHFELTTKLLLDSDLVADPIDGAMSTGA
jgi:DNA-binding GntR family transcriptional regulator